MDLAVSFRRIATVEQLQLYRHTHRHTVRTWLSKRTWLSSWILIRGFSC